MPGFWELMQMVLRYRYVHKNSDTWYEDISIKLDSEVVKVMVK